MRRHSFRSLLATYAPVGLASGELEPPLRGPINPSCFDSYLQQLGMEHPTVPMRLISQDGGGGT